MESSSFAGLGLDQLVDAEAHAPGPGELGGAEIAGGEIEQGQGRHWARDVEGGEVVVAFRRQRRVNCGSGGEDPGDFAADDLLGELGIFHLLADGDPVALAQQAGEVIVGGVVGHATHGHGTLFIPCGERYL